MIISLDRQESLKTLSSTFQEHVFRLFGWVSKNWWDLSNFSVGDHHFPYSMDIIGGHWDWAVVDF